MIDLWTVVTAPGVGICGDQSNVSQAVDPWRLGRDSSPHGEEFSSPRVGVVYNENGLCKMRMYYMSILERNIQCHFHVHFWYLHPLWRAMASVRQGVTRQCHSDAYLSHSSTFTHTSSCLRQTRRRQAGETVLITSVDTLLTVHDEMGPGWTLRRGGGGDTQLRELR